jgi:hypothetical protein
MSAVAVRDRGAKESRTRVLCAWCTTHVKLRVAGRQVQLDSEIGCRCSITLCDRGEADSSNTVGKPTARLLLLNNLLLESLKKGVLRCWQGPLALSPHRSGSTSAHGAAPAKSHNKYGVLYNVRTMYYQLPPLPYGEARIRYRRLG